MTKAIFNLINSYGGDRIVLYFVFHEEGNPSLTSALTDLISLARLNPESFDTWVGQSFTEGGDPAQVRVASHPVIYFNPHGGNFSYSVVVDADREEVLLYRCERCIFAGTFGQADAFLTHFAG